MIKCRMVDPNGKNVGDISAPSVPVIGDVILAVNNENLPVPYTVHSRVMYTKPGLNDPCNRYVCDFLLIVHTEAETTPDCDYKHGGYVPNKYKVIKQDGTPTDPAANYFVLRLDVDPHALNALKVYADSVESDNRLFANDLRALMKNMRELQKRRQEG